MINFFFSKMSRKRKANFLSPKRTLEDIYDTADYLVTGGQFQRNNRQRINDFFGIPQNDASESNNDIPMASKRKSRSSKKTSYKRRSRKRSYRRTYRKRSKLTRLLYERAVRENPAKHILWSDNGVTGGASFGFGAVACADSQPQIALINPMARGTTVQTRVGDFTYTSKVYMRCQTQFGTAVSGDTYLRFFLILGKDVKGTALTAATFQTDYFGCSLANCRMDALPNINNKDFHARYKILRSWTIFMKESVAGINETRVWNLSHTFKKPIKTSYVLGNAGTVADIDSGALYIMCMSNSTALVAATGVTTLIEGRVYFRD